MAMIKRPSVEIRRLIEEVPASQQLPWWEWNVAENRVVASPRKVTMLGYDAAAFNEAGYQAYMALVHPDDYERTMDAMRDHLEGRALLYEIDYRIRRQSGEYTWYMDRGAILQRSDEGAPLMLRGVVIDLGTQLSVRAGEDAVVTAIRQALPSATGAPLSVCAQCGRLRYGQQEWVEVPADVTAGFPAEVSHGLCPECIAVLYPTIAGQVLQRLHES